MNLEPRQVWRFRNGKYCLILPKEHPPREARRLMRLAKRTIGIGKSDFQSMIRASEGEFDEAGGLLCYLGDREWWTLSKMMHVLPPAHHGYKYMIWWS